MAINKKYIKVFLVFIIISILLYIGTHLLDDNKSTGTNIESNITNSEVTKESINTIDSVKNSSNNTEESLGKLSEKKVNILTQTKGENNTDNKNHTTTNQSETEFDKDLWKKIPTPLIREHTTNTQEKDIIAIENKNTTLSLSGSSNSETNIISGNLENNNNLSNNIDSNNKSATNNNQIAHNSNITTKIVPVYSGEVIIGTKEIIVEKNNGSHSPIGGNDNDFFTIQEKNQSSIITGNDIISQSMRMIEKQIYFLPDSIKEEIYSLKNGATLTKKSDYIIINKGNIYLYIKGSKTNVEHAILLIPGKVTPKAQGLFKVAEGSKLEDVIIYAVSAGKDQSDVSYKKFPGKLSEIVNKSYLGSIDLKVGLHGLVRGEIHGTLAEVLQEGNYPTDNLIINVGQEYPGLNGSTGFNAILEENKKDSNATEALKPTHYLEITRIGDWVNPINIEGITLNETTVYYDDGNNFGFWGVGNFENNPFVAFYKGPLVKSKDPADYLEAQFGFGAEKINLGEYLKLTSAYNSRLPNNSYLFAGKLNNLQKETLNNIFKGIDSLPLDVIEIKNPQLKNFVFKTGDKFPDIKKFNLVGLGPLASSKDGTSGPLISIAGNSSVFGETFGKFGLVMNDKKIQGKTSGNLNIDLGEIAEFDLGKIGGEVQISIDADKSSQKMKLNGKFNAGYFGGQDISINMKNNTFDFSTFSSCTMPFNIHSSASISDIANTKISDLTFIPKAGVPDPSQLLNCPEDIYYIFKNGALVAFNGTVKIAEFAENLLPENEVTKVGIEGLKFAGGVAFQAPEEILKIAEQVPGVGELGELKGYLEDQAKKAAAAAAKAAQKAAEEAAKAAEEAAKAAQKAAEEAARAAKAALNEGFNQINNLTTNGPSSVINGLSSVVSSIGGVFGGSSPSLPGFAFRHIFPKDYIIDISAGHRYNTGDNVADHWAIAKDGRALAIDDKGRWNFDGTYKTAGLPTDFPGFARIDAGSYGGAAAVDKNAKLWTYNGSTWNLTNANYAIDVGIGGGWIWIISGTPHPLGWPGNTIWRAPYTKGQTAFKWEQVTGAGWRIDVGSDGKPWATNKDLQVWQWTAHNNWVYREAYAIDITVSASNKAWIVDAIDYNHQNLGGGRIRVYEQFCLSTATGQYGCRLTGWQNTQGGGTAIAAGYGVLVWPANSHGRLYVGTGRR